MKMRKFAYILSAFALLVIVLSGCEKEITTSVNEDTEYEYFVNIQLLGEEVMLIEVGTPYVDPGFTAVEGEFDRKDSVIVSGDTPDGDVIGYYEVNYSADNVNGYPTSVSRSVIVYDPGAPATDLTGKWNGTRIGIGGGATKITKLAPGIFECSDLFGGYYEFIAGYGAAYRLHSYIQLFDDNTYEALSTNSPWGPWGVLSGVYDPDGGADETGTMYHIVDFGGFQFEVLLTYVPEE